MKSRIGYIRKEEVPFFKIPSYLGKRYEEMIPDTLDLAERAKLAIHALTEPTDPDADYEPYGLIDFFHNPPIMHHCWQDWIHVIFLQDLPLLRIATGSDLNSQVDTVWMKVILKSIGPDGLLYIPIEGRPWARLHPSLHNPVWRADGTTTSVEDETVTHLTCPFVSNYIIGALTVYYLRDKNPVWKEAVERMIQRLSHLAIDKGDYCYFPGGVFEPNAKLNLNAEMPTGVSSIDSGGGRLIQGLSQFYKATGYEPAKKLAGKLVRYQRDYGKYYDAEGRFLPDAPGGEHFHFHSHTYGLVSMLDYALAVDDQELMEFVKKGYEYAKTKGNPLVGFFPEDIVPYYPTSEICEVADMIALAVKLSEADVGDYWDDADRWVRNQFAENQLTKTDWVYRIPKQTIPYPPPRLTIDDPRFKVVNEKVAERNLGAFAGWSTGSDWGIAYGIMHCCTGNGARTIYYVWERILNYDEGLLRVNLLLNRTSPWADVNSYIPYEGRVDIKIKQPCKNVLVRMPEWIENKSQQVACTINSEPRKVSWSGRYVNIGAAKSGDTLIVSFPIWEQMATSNKPLAVSYPGLRGSPVAKEMIGDTHYTIIMKGNTVVYIDPPGKYCPLYQRDHYRENQVRWVKRERFAPKDPIEW